MGGVSHLAGYSRIYCFGDEGGFMGADGINPITVQVWQGEGGRQWLEARYFDPSVVGMGRVRRIVPQEPDHPDALLDATIAFIPDYYRGCPSLQMVSGEVADTEMLDFDHGENIPPSWSKLREEARIRFAELRIYVADLEPLRCT